MLLRPVFLVAVFTLSVFLLSVQPADAGMGWTTSTYQFKDVDSPIYLSVNSETKDFKLILPGETYIKHDPKMKITMSPKPLKL
ncbi:MAG: hypothetical protein PHT62_11470 [Desulfotomaculaceae bacterium]|nr:hypothetical protein [Desulfotomaculaceae bacterium]